ncbi:MAG: methyltransferase domain-containing protein [Candidatus Dormibacteraeota bacterium]|nr:methyltransferase domain-containing protein [Candidatus Dormibacteraeota bacterium]
MGTGSSGERVERLLRQFGLGEDDRAAWEASGLDGGAFDDWLTDRVARRPGGQRARRVYGAEDVHDFARVAILDALALQPGDRLLEIGCGGGLLLRDALTTRAAVTGLDHSAEMVEVARQTAESAALLIADARRLPFLDHSFTAVAMSVVFFFFSEPVSVLRECRRALTAGGRLAVYTTGPELRGTPASPEPLASRGHFYEDAALASLAEEAGFTEARVVNQRGGQLLTARLG